MILIDGDHIVHRAAGSCEPTKLKPFLESREDAIARADSMMEKLLTEQLQNWDYELYIGGEGNWRKAIYPEYKANRKEKRVATWLQDVREHLVVNWKAQIINDIEVDDKCGIELTAGTEEDICVSLDKDLLTVPGCHYNFVKEKLQYVTQIQAWRNFYSQVITGDSSDNVPAFDGKFRNSVPQFIEKMLEPIQEMTEEYDMYAYALHIYCQDESQEDIFERNAKVLWIQKKEGDMWQRPNWNGPQLDAEVSL